MSIRDYLYDRRNGFVMRWHARQTQRQETLAEHHYFVTRDALLIGQALRYYHIAEPNLHDIMLMAMIHDEVEKETGDVSGETKRRFPELKKKLNEIERVIIDEQLFNNLPGRIGDEYRALALRVSAGVDGGTDSEDLEGQIVKYADKLEAYLFALTELNVGNSLMNPVVAAIEREMEALYWPWLVELRKETGLP